MINQEHYVQDNLYIPTTLWAAVIIYTNAKWPVHCTLVKGG